MVASPRVPETRPCRRRREAARQRLGPGARRTLTTRVGPTGAARWLAVSLVAALLLASCSGQSVRTAAPAPASPSPAASAGGVVGEPPGAASGAPTTTPSPTPVPLVPAPTDGVLESPAAAERPVIAVMIDDAPAARPQSGLAEADILFQAPAEGGIPRYMALYQSGVAPSIGPIRSSRLYFVGWAAAWNPLYAHVGGAPNALAALDAMNGTSIWNADEFRWAAYMPRITTRVAPHNVYSSSQQLDDLAARLGVPPAPSPAWTFVDPAPPAARPAGGSLVVPYPAGVISYAYDPSTDRYLRSVDGAPEIDPGTGARVAPYDVVVVYVQVGPLLNAPGQATNQAKGRLEIGYTGSGQALVLRDGIAIEARWNKASDTAPLLLTQAAGPNAGAPIPLVRGQIAIQVVPIGTPVTLSVQPRMAPGSRSTPA